MSRRDVRRRKERAEHRRVVEQLREAHTRFDVYAVVPVDPAPPLEMMDGDAVDVREPEF